MAVQLLMQLERHKCVYEWVCVWQHHHITNLKSKLHNRIELERIDHCHYMFGRCHSLNIIYMEWPNLWLSYVWLSLYISWFNNNNNYNNSSSSINECHSQYIRMMLLHWNMKRGGRRRRYIQCQVKDNNNKMGRQTVG